MAGGDRYRQLAAEFEARAESERYRDVRTEWNRIAQAYRRLATLADKNNKGGLLIEMVKSPPSR